jgi:hypothetical protein
MRYIEISPDRFKDFCNDGLTARRRWFAVTGVPVSGCNRVRSKRGRKQKSDCWGRYSGKSSARCQKLPPFFILIVIGRNCHGVIRAMQQSNTLKTS